MADKGLTYAEAGVDIDAGNRMVELIRPLVRATAAPAPTPRSAEFGGLFDLKPPATPIRSWSRRPTGSEPRSRSRSNRTHDTIGIDLVAMSVNDLVVQGAEPLFFLDYFACGKLDPRSARRGQGRRGRLPAGGLRADRRRDSRDARPLSGRRL